jgi:nicotinate-nucleotide adenylyltransferase
VRIGLLGGSFDPIHNGHLYVAYLARAFVPLDRVLFIPAHVPPHKVGQVLAPSAQRVAMVRAAIRGHDEFEVSEVELAREGRSYTIDTVAQVASSLPQADLFFLIGSDSLRDLPTWHRARELANQVTFVTVARSRGQILEVMGQLESALGSKAAATIRAHVIEVPPLPISSTEIRERARRGESLENLVPDPVAELIASTGLYRDHS